LERNSRRELTPLSFIERKHLGRLEITKEENLMRLEHSNPRFSGLMLVLVASLVVSAPAENKKGNKYACSEPTPASQCNQSNTCGSASTPCSMDVKRTSYSASATPSIAGAKANSLVCVKKGTKVTWQSSSKNTGFLVDFGASSPFDPPDPIVGGSKKSVEVQAATPGCYVYAFQASDSTGIYGMSKASQAELIILGGD
jgi:hypothetical protein